MVAKVTYCWVRWQGHASAADSWEPVEHPANLNCPERVAEYRVAEYEARAPPP